jgi:hypothetical protein
MSSLKDKSKSKKTTDINLSDNGSSDIPNNTLKSSNTQFNSEPISDSISDEAVLPYSEVHICTSREIKNLQKKKSYGNDVKKSHKISRRQQKDLKNKFLIENPDNLTIFILPDSHGPSVTTYNFSDETSNKKTRK